MPLQRLHRNRSSSSSQRPPTTTTTKSIQRTIIKTNEKSRTNTQSPSPPPPSSPSSKHKHKQPKVKVVIKPKITKSTITRSKRIWDLLIHIPTFTLRFLRLVSFVLFLLPAFVVFVWHYVVCDRIAVYYGDHIVDGDHDGDQHEDGCCIEEENDETTTIDFEKESIVGTSSGSFKNMDVCTNGNNGVTIRENVYRVKRKRKDPFLSRHYLDIYGSRTTTPTIIPTTTPNNLPNNNNNNNNKKPVVIFLTGGAWIIGYRMWGTLLARALSPFGILCIVPDYRNFPRVNIEGMVRDVDAAIQWVMDHAEEYGGDRDRVVLVGQSAGAHIGGVVVARKGLDWLCCERRRRRMECSRMNAKGSMAVVVEDNNMENESGAVEMMMSPLRSTYSPQQLCGFISTSSPANLVTMRPVLHHHGLSASVQNSIFGEMVGDDDDDDFDVFEKWSPYHIMIECHTEYVKLLELDDDDDDDDGTSSSEDRLRFKDVFPRFCVIHGTADKTVPISEAKKFISLLTKLQIPTDVKLYEGWTHTDPILEAPMRGDHTYHRDVYEMVCKWTTGKGKTATSKLSHANKEKKCQIGQREAEDVFDERHHPMLQPICPSVLVEAARFCNPF